MKKLKTPTAVTTAMLTLITLFFWAGFQLYRALTTKPTPPVANEILNPIDPTLDTKSLDTISSRLVIDDSQIKNTAITITTPTPLPTVSPVTPSPSATSSGTPQPTATGSATPTATP